MIDTYKVYPFWRSRISDVDEMLDSARRGKTGILCTSAGGRTIRTISYGEKPDLCRRANYVSACGAKDTRFYADREGKSPVIMLIGATHGQETEGVAALMNLISLLETYGVVAVTGQLSLEEEAIFSRFKLCALPISAHFALVIVVSEHGSPRNIEAFHKRINS